MKKAIILMVLVFTGLFTNAQNFLGQTQKQVEYQLDKKGYIYEGYVNTKGTYSITIDKVDESRIYVFDYASICSEYYIHFSDAEMIYSYGKIFNSTGYKQVKGNLDQEEHFLWEFTSAKSTAICLEVDGKYYIVVRLK